MWHYFTATTTFDKRRIPYTYHRSLAYTLTIAVQTPSDVNKDLTFKAKDKDQTLKVKDQDKDQTPKDKDKDQTFKAKDQDKD